MESENMTQPISGNTMAVKFYNSMYAMRCRKCGCMLSPNFDWCPGCGGEI